MTKDIEKAFNTVKSYLAKQENAEAIDRFDDIRLAFVKLDRECYGLRQTNSNLKEKLEKRYQSIPW